MFFYTVSLQHLEELESESSGPSEVEEEDAVQPAGTRLHSNALTTVAAKEVLVVAALKPKKKAAGSSEGTNTTEGRTHPRRSTRIAAKARPAPSRRQ